MADDDDCATTTAAGLEVAEAAAPAEPAGRPGERVSSPRKVMRIGAMLKELLGEVRNMPLDETSREKLAEVHDTSVKELSACLSPDLQAELHALTLPFDNEAAEGAALTDGELRIAQAQLVGWLDGLLHGIQTAMAAQRATTAKPPTGVVASVAAPSSSEKSETNSDLNDDAAPETVDDDDARPGQYL